MRSSSIGRQLPVEATDDDQRIIDFVRPYTMTSDARIWALLQSVQYIQDHDISGDVVECGVWRGGSMMAAALKLRELKDETRRLWLYDTFTGMTPPTSEDREAATGQAASEMLRVADPSKGDNVWCLADETDVRANLHSTQYPDEKMVFVRGDVTETLRESIPNSIALLRLDTDWYQSTDAELQHLYRLLVPGGVCVLDDYGHWQGARKAVDDFFNDNPPRPLMLPIDYSGRIFLKPQ